MKSWRLWIKVVQDKLPGRFFIKCIKHFWSYLHFNFDGFIGIIPTQVQHGPPSTIWLLSIDQRIMEIESGMKKFQGLKVIPMKMTFGWHGKESRAQAHISCVSSCSKLSCESYKYHLLTLSTSNFFYPTYSPHWA